MTEKREINLEHPAYPKYATVYSEKDTDAKACILYFHGGRAAVRQQGGSAPKAYRYPDPGRIYHHILRLPSCARRQAGYHNG